MFKHVKDACVVCGDCFESDGETIVGILGSVKNPEGAFVFGMDVEKRGSTEVVKLGCVSELPACVVVRPRHGEWKLFKRNTRRFSVMVV
jgi:hypothetical protein